MYAYPDLQEAFNAWAHMPADLRALMYDTAKVDDEFEKTIKTEGLTDELFDRQAEIAEKYGLTYVHPKYTRGPKVVATTGKTVH